jgi:hypothetical protein
LSGYPNTQTLCCHIGFAQAGLDRGHDIGNYPIRALLKLRWVTVGYQNMASRIYQRRLYLSTAKVNTQGRYHAISHQLSSSRIRALSTMLVSLVNRHFNQPDRFCQAP